MASGRNTFVVAFVGLTILAGPSARAQYHEYDEWHENYTVQALLGAIQYKDLKFKIADSTTEREIDNSVLPQLGGAWTTLPAGGHFQYGLETSFLLGFKFDKVNYVVIRGGTVEASLSYRLWMFDLAGGAYINVFPDPARKIRIYGGAGPLLMYAEYRADRQFNNGDENESNTESALGIGAYARTGIEFRIHERGTVGLGARASWSNIDLTNSGGRNKLAGLAAFATYTAGF